VFGATYMVLAPEHPLVDRLTTDDQRDAVETYRARAAAVDIVSRRIGDKDKTGAFTGAYCRNPATDERIPIWIADYVLMEYGTGAIMAVPGHDERDWQFATTFGLDIRPVVQPDDDADAAGEERAPALFTGWHGTLVNSGSFDGMSCREAVEAITAWLQEKGAAAPKTQYRLHDWCISRQRYWGPPIPVIYCDACGTVPVPESDLPVLLPPLDDFRPDESGVSPLARNKEWHRVSCPTCGKEARRETDVSDTFLDSAWYFLRYPSTDFDDRAFDSARTRSWLPVNSYIGGNEHAVLHLMYARFITMVLHDLGFLEFEEPFTRFRAHGMIVKDGAKMSKSRGNVVIPDEYIAKWGADTFRMYLMFLGPYQEGGDFRDEGISGIRRFLDKVWGLVCAATFEGGEITAPTMRKLHQTIRGVAEDFEELRYNTAISKLMEYVNVLRGKGADDTSVPDVCRELLEPLIVMLAPLAPHFAEECWERLHHRSSVFAASWPTFDPTLAEEDQVELVVQVNGKVRGRVSVPAGIGEADAIERAVQVESVQRFVEGKPIKKTVYVEDRLVSLVV
jgi:leucyl-tRNA synthetase